MTIETLTNSITRNLKVYSGKIKYLENEFQLHQRLNKLVREVLLALPNPKHKEIINKYNHLDGMQMRNIDTKSMLLIYVKLGASDFAKIKMGACLNKQKWDWLSCRLVKKVIY